MHHTGCLWKENKKQQNTLNRKSKRDWSRETTPPATARADHTPTLRTSSATENRRMTPESPGNHPPHLERQAVIHTRQIRELPPWRVQATRRAWRACMTVARSCWTEKGRWPLWRGACL
jgi:hypothetical protein